MVAPSASSLSVIIGIVVAVVQTGALAAAAAVTSSVALRTQTVTSVVDIAVGGGLLVAIVSSRRPANDRHPLGYGREGFFWSFIAAAGLFVGGVGATAAETVRAALHPEPGGHYVVGYLVLGTVIALDVVGLLVSLKSLVARARGRHLPLIRYLWTSTEPAVTTVFLSSAAGLAGGVIAMLGLAGRQLTGSHVCDVVASALIGLVLLVASVLLLHSSRDLLTGRGIATESLAAMKADIELHPGVVGVPDLFAIVVGPATLILDADVIFDDRLDVPRLESVIVAVAAQLRATWPQIVYVYLNPVAASRERRHPAMPVRSRLEPGGRAWRRTRR